MKMLSNCFVAVVILICSATQAVADFASIPDVKRSEFHSFARYDFSFADRACIVVQPHQAAEGTPWIWRARFFGHEPQFDVAMLERGFHIAYVDVAGLYGAPAAVDIWDRFHEHMVSTHGFSQRPFLEGMSRGGLIVFNWAKKNPSRVCGIYADAPVCDIKSWPGGKGLGKGSVRDWTQCLAAYSLTEAQAIDDQNPDAKCNPIDGLGRLAAERVPVLCVVGDADEVVPVAENTAILESRYQKLGGPIRVIHKPGIGHHPHSLKDPQPIVDFAIDCWEVN